MKQLNLRQILSRNDVRKSIEVNLFKTEAETLTAIEKTLQSNNFNSISVETTYDGRIAKFENTLHVDKNKKVYLLESRLFDNDDSMVNSYLEIFDADGKIIEELIDDVWTYADWKEVQEV